MTKTRDNINWRRKMTKTKRVFLPKYSYTYMENKKDIVEYYWLILIVFIFLIGIGGINYIFHGEDFIYEYGIQIILCVITAIYLIFIRKKLIEDKKIYGAVFLPEGIKKITKYGESEIIPYKEYVKFIREGKYYYTQKGIVIGKGKKKLIFYYENKSKFEKENVIACYEKLQEYVQQELPPFETSNFDLWEKYNIFIEEFKKSTILLTGTSLIFSLYKNKFHIVFLILICLVEIFCLCNFLNNAILFRENYKVLKSSISDINIDNLFGKRNKKTGSSYLGYIYYVMILAVLVIFNSMNLFWEPEAQKSPIIENVYQLDYIQEYEVDVKVREDGSLDMHYHLVWELLDHPEEAPLKYVKLEIPNNKIKNVEVLSETISLIEYVEEDNKDYLKMYLNNHYQTGDIIELEFNINQQNMYKRNFIKGICTYSFTPGTFVNIRVGSMKISWEKENVKGLSNGYKETEDNYYWTTSLGCGEQYTINVEYADNAYDYQYILFDSYHPMNKILFMLYVFVPIIMSGIFIVVSKLK